MKIINQKVAGGTVWTLWKCKNEDCGREVMSKVEAPDPDSEQIPTTPPIKKAGA